MDKLMWFDPLSTAPSGKCKNRIFHETDPYGIWSSQRAAGMEEPNSIHRQAIGYLPANERGENVRRGAKI